MTTVQERAARECHLVFVGEKRSKLAVSMGVTWEGGRLAAKTLHEALIAADIDPHKQRYINVFLDGEGFVVDETAIAELRRSVAAEQQLIALGRRVHRALSVACIQHAQMVHPAARGKIRKRERYQAHVAAVVLTEDEKP